MIYYICTLYINIKGIAKKYLLYIMGCRRENIILRLPWLHTMNLIIDWIKQTLTISEPYDQSKDPYSAHVADTQQYDSF